MSEAPAAQTIDISGPFRRPRNMAVAAPRPEGAAPRGGGASIHDDATAAKLGFKGGTVAGSVHMDQFAPLLISLYGDDFFERGNISLYFKTATVDNEPVRAFARRAGDAQARLWMENEAGALVAEGSASLGLDTDTTLTRLMASQKTGGDLRILSEARVGDVSTPSPSRHDSETMLRRQAAITEPLAMYRGEGRWAGRHVVPIGTVVQMCRAGQNQILKRTGAVGLFGALELQYVNGPVFADTDYSVVCKTLALSESPKTENMWWSSVMSEAATGKEICRHLQYVRFMKASSPLWADAKSP